MLEISKSFVLTHQHEHNNNENNVDIVSTESCKGINENRKTINGKWVKFSIRNHFVLSNKIKKNGVRKIRSGSSENFWLKLIYRESAKTFWLKENLFTIIFTILIYTIPFRITLENSTMERLWQKKDYGKDEIRIYFSAIA